MGCQYSIDFVPNELVGQGPEVLEVGDTLKMTTKEIGTLFVAFNDIDSDYSGFISTDEISKYFELQDGLFAQRLISAFDADKTNRLSFVEFIVMVYNLCSIPEKQYPGLIFMMSCPSLDYSATRPEVVKMFESYFEKKIIYTPANDVLEKFESTFSSTKTKFSFDDFCEMCQNPPSALFTPLIKKIKRMRELIFGAYYWINVIKDRVDDPIRGKVEFIFKIRDKLNELNNLNNKAQHLQSYNSKVNAVKQARDDKVAGRKKSVLLTYFDLRQETDKKKLKDHHYKDGGDSRRRRSIIKPNLQIKGSQHSTNTKKLSSKSKDKKFLPGGPGGNKVAVRNTKAK